MTRLGNWWRRKFLSDDKPEPSPRPEEALHALSVSKRERGEIAQHWDEIISSEEVLEQELKINHFAERFESHFGKGRRQ